MIIPVPNMPVQQQQQPQPTPMKQAAAPKKIARPISPPPRAPYSRSNVYQKAHVPVPLKAQALETIAERSSVASRSTVSGSRGVTSGSRGIASGSRGIASGIASTQSASAANKSGSHNNKTGSTAYRGAEESYCHYPYPSSTASESCQSHSRKGTCGTFGVTPTGYSIRCCEATCTRKRFRR